MAMAAVTPGALGLSDVACVEFRLLDGLGIAELLCCRSASMALRACAAQAWALNQASEHLVTVGGATVQARAAALRRLGLVADGCDAPARRRVARRALQCLGDGSAACLRKAAAIVLTRLSGDWEENQPGVAVVLEPALADDDVTVSTMAAKALACVAPKNEAVAAALRQLTHPSPKVRAAALGVLGQVAVRTRLVVRRVIEMLVDLDWQVRAAACRALPRVVERGESSAAEALQAALTKDLDGRVRRAAAGALVHVVPHPSLPFLILKAEEAKQVKRKAPPGPVRVGSERRDVRRR
ncbi:unnamed protein product [Durusdinium trenchii]|uniref:Uncharacterized protein n=2 Tax=Durusdinium trenchii TaxID=1381693 RepID=A0ABP0M1Q7_9DINO